MWVSVDVFLHLIDRHNRWLADWQCAILTRVSFTGIGVLSVQKRLEMCPSQPQRYLYWRAT